jgi:hypothetical protein
MLDSVDTLMELKSDDIYLDTTGANIHKLKDGVICNTEPIASVPSPASLVLDATDGFIPLWAHGSVLHWRFNFQSLDQYVKAEELKEVFRQLFARAIIKWDEASPIRFKEVSETPDFEVYIEKFDRCTPSGCTLANAFFPGPGHEKLFVYPKMFKQSTKEQVDSLAHEIGHIYGLRHFFASEKEKMFPSEVFGDHDPFTIMNYGTLSELTDQDKSDLATLYTSVWAGSIYEINRTPIKLFSPYHVNLLR